MERMMRVCAHAPLLMAACGHARSQIVFIIISTAGVNLTGAAAATLYQIIRILRMIRCGACRCPIRRFRPGQWLHSSGRVRPNPHLAARPELRPEQQLQGPMVYCRRPCRLCVRAPCLMKGGGGRVMAWQPEQRLQVPHEAVRLRAPAPGSCRS